MGQTERAERLRGRGTCFHVISDRRSDIPVYMGGYATGEHEGKGNPHTSDAKPVALYDWIFANYTQRGQKIIDTHVGSASSLIAAHKAGLQFVGFELDREYYKDAAARYERETAQISIFDFLEQKGE
ncbi:site-specific DNA-methyltransferase [bacterium 0.1xD8-71]|nr:site-specific DNA-methyltransferase [bacterium 0.1xD8-71]